MKLSYDTGEFAKKLNLFGKNRIPFGFIISFDKTSYDIFELSKQPINIKYKLTNQNYLKHNTILKYEKFSFAKYTKMFNKVQTSVASGNTYLLNLTATTPLKIKISLDEIYNLSNSSFKLLYKDKFVCFSPEKFIEIKNNEIYTYPMKGTIDYKIKNAKQKLIDSKKELAEHTMVVDLLRNDISKVASKTKVEKFRYINKITTKNKTILQTSSLIKGYLGANWQNNIGYIVDSLLPAGSITGTPKIETTKLIKNIECRNRTYYTGVFGIYDGINFKSYVLIRYIKRDNSGSLFYESGGGITSDSKISNEYKELNDKIYLP